MKTISFPFGVKAMFKKNVRFVSKLLISVAFRHSFFYCLKGCHIINQHIERKNVMSDDLKKRCKTMIETTEVPVSKFCRRIGISPTAYYRWQKGDLNLGEKTLRTIQADLERLRY